MMFVLRMAGRETRAAWRRLLFFFLCIAVGVAAIVTLRSVIESVRGVFGREAKALIAADVLISTNAEWTDEARQTIDRRLAEFGSPGADRVGRDADDVAAGGWPGGRPDGRAARGAARAFRSTGRSVSRAARPTHTRCCATTARWSVRSC